MGKHEKIEKWNLSMRSGYDLRVLELEAALQSRLEERRQLWAQLASSHEQQHMDAQTIETLRSQLEIARKDVATLYDRSSFVVAPGDMYQPSIFVAYGEDYNTKMLARGIRVFII
jgi:hypothetical protein